MKYFLTIITICLFTLSAWAQPVNDDCAGFIDLGTAPSCTDDIYTNVNATATVIGGGTPSCFNAITPSQDVFFAFTVDPAFVDLTITVSGSALGPNGVAITNPEIAIYRGDCSFLAELFCANSGVEGNNIIRFDAIGLTPGLQYFIRVNNASDSAAPLWGDFQVCIEEYVPPVIMGETTSSDACFGTILDSGGIDDDYSNDENSTFTICPTDVTQCIALDVASFNIIVDDILNIYAGSDINAPVIASLNNMGNDNDFTILASSSCVTLEFISDGTTTSAGFEINWQCNASACDGSSFDNPTSISGIPYNNTNLSTCGEGATFNQTPCSNNAFFLNGPEVVFEYTSEGGYCASVEITNAATGTGVLVLNGLPDDPGTLCLASSPTGDISSVNFEEPGIYYIVVANAAGCTDFGLSIQEATCTLPTSLVDALCNPLNGCVDAGMVSEFIFEDGFQDIPLTLGVNDGCWGGVGIESDYVWFSIQAATDGPFGFILQGTNFASDIDFNVWGPFTVEQVCETPQMVIDAATNTQPIRSSYDGGTEPTGLADIHPQFGYEIEDVYDCQGLGDDIVQTIAAQEGEVYIVLANDWGNDIIDGAISIDWSPSDPDVIGPFLGEGETVAVNDTSVCAGEPVLIEVITGVDNIEWIGDNIDQLSCTDCFTPTATPTETTVYQAVLNLTCYIDTISVRVNVFDLDAGPDWTICLGEEFQIPAGEDFSTAIYEWSPPTGLEFDCTDCGSPIIIAQAPGVYEVPVTLTAEGCNFMDMVTITVLDNPAPTYTIADDQQICAGETIAIGGDPNDNNNYSWTSVPTTNIIDPVANPLVAPTQTTTYYLGVTNGNCPVTSVDSVVITVVQLPIIDILASADTICNGDTLSLENSIVEEDVSYSWTGQEEIFNPDSVFTFVFPSSTAAYTLVGERMGCFTEDVINIEVINIDIDLEQQDTVLLCFGEEVTLSPFVHPADADIQWNQADVIGNTPTLSPSTNTTYIATVTNDICVLMDTLYIQVDSIPLDMTITADPEKESYCQGELVQLLSPIYEPANYPHIEHQWAQIGMETSDTLYNFVLTTVDTFTYIRTTTSGACSQMDTITLDVITNNMTITPAVSEICQGESVDLLIIADTLGVIEWMPTDGLSCTDCPNPTATPNSTISYTASTEIDGCPIEASATINVMEVPAINLIDDLLDCPGATVDLNTASPENGTTYVWSSSTSPSFTSAEASINIVVGATTTYTLTATNTCGEVTDNVTIEQVTAPTITMPGDLTICAGLAFELEAVLANAENVTSQVWIYDGESEVGNPSSFIATLTGDIASFEVEYGTANKVCGTFSEIVGIDVQDAPVINLLPDTTICFNNEMSFVLNTADENTDATYIWSSAQDAAFSSNEYAPIVMPTATTTYDLEANVGDCSVSGSVTITILSPETLTVGEDQLITATNTDAMLEANVENGTPGSFVWIFNDAIVLPMANGSFTPDTMGLPGYAYLTYTNACETLTDSIFIQSFLYQVPNIFSPNGDLVNAVFKPFFTGEMDMVELTVFNRWGQLVFESTDPANPGWDGMVDGNPAPSDMYIYILRIGLDGIVQEEKGAVTLIR